MPTLYPLFIKLEGRRVLVIGAGAVAERKIEELVLSGAEVLVVSPAATPRVRALARAREVRWARRPFVAADFDGAWLAIAATEDAKVQKRAAAAAAKRDVF